MEIYVGYDPREDIAYDVCEFSIKKHNPSAQVIPLKQSELRAKGLYWRDVDPLSSTEFTFTRFLVPALKEYNGWAVFCDCDFLWMINPAELFALTDDKYAVMVVKHDYEPKETTKMDNCKQHLYPRKNWSSMILFNCGHPSNKALTPEVVNSQTGQFLHRFQWLKDEEIGEVSYAYNWLVDWYHEDNGNVTPKVLHYTLGGPWFEEYKNCSYSKEWEEYKAEMEAQKKEID